MAKTNQDTIVTIRQNPEIDFVFGLFDGEPIPVKKEQFKPVEMTKINDDGSKEIIRDFYIKEPDNDAVRRFTKWIQDCAQNVIVKDEMIMPPHEVEVIIDVSIKPNRYKNVDVDNIAKCVLDSLTGIAYKDDSQVASLIIRKVNHPMETNGILIGITKMRPEKPGFNSKITLYSVSDEDKIKADQYFKKNGYPKKDKNGNYTY